MKNANAPTLKTTTVLPGSISSVTPALTTGCLGGVSSNTALHTRGAQESDQRHHHLLRARRERPRSRCAAECGQQFPPSDGDCHAPLPCEVRKRNDTTPRCVQSSGSRS